MSYISLRQIKLIKIAAKKSEDLDALREIFSLKYPGERAAPGFAIQYYNKFIRTSDLSVTLTEENLPQRLPETIEELKALIQSVEVIRSKSKKEELVENIKSKYNNIDLTNLNEDYLLWLNMRYIESKHKPGEIVHPIEEAIETLGKFSSIQQKYDTSIEFKNKVNEAGYKDISSIKDLTLDDMESIIALNTSGLTVRVDGVKIKGEEFLGKFGEWNLWLPHTKETSVKIVGYDKNYNPKTTWCTARTKGSNLFYNYIGRKDIPVFLFYIIKDNPEKTEDWLSIGYVSSRDRLVPDFSGRDGGLSVNRDNKGLKEESYAEILGEEWVLIKSRIESEIEKYSISGAYGKTYISPARSIIEGLAKSLEEFKKELKPKSNEEKEDFAKVILDSNPSEDVRFECAKVLAKLNPHYFLKKFSEEPWAGPYVDLAVKNSIEKDPSNFLIYFLEKPWAPPYIDLAAKSCIEKNPGSFLHLFSEKPWAQPYLDLAAKSCIEKDSDDFLSRFSEKPWAQPYLDLAVKIYLEINAYLFLVRFLEKPWAQPYIDLAAKKSIDKDARFFLFQFSEKPWAGPYIDLAAKSCIEKNHDDFLDRFSEKPWAQPYLDLAAKSCIEKDVFNFLFKFSKKPWAGPYIDLAAKKSIEKDPDNFLIQFSEKPWAQPYIDLAAKNCIEKYPFYFPRLFSEKPWANTPVESIGGKTWIEYAESMKKKSGYNNNFLIKLSRALNDLGFNEYGYAVKKLSKY
jgi:hypothetical protein